MGEKLQEFIRKYWGEGQWLGRLLLAVVVLVIVFITARQELIVIYTSKPGHTKVTIDQEPIKDDKRSISLP